MSPTQKNSVPEHGYMSQGSGTLLFGMVAVTVSVPGDRVLPKEYGECAPCRFLAGYGGQLLGPTIYYIVLSINT